MTFGDVIDQLENNDSLTHARPAERTHAGGVQVDGAWAADVNYDSSWNGVWDGAARIDSLG